MSAGRVCVVGSLNVDLRTGVRSFPQPGETVLGSDVETGPGGKGANQAVAAALCGAHVTMVGAVGTDHFADEALSGLRRAGADVSGVHVLDGSTGLALITVDARAENTIVVASGANAQLSPDHVRQSGHLLADAEVLLMQGEVAAEVVDAAALAAPLARLVFNSAPVLEVSAETLRRADPLVVNATEAGDIAQLLSVEPDDDSVSTLAEAITGSGVPSLIVTLGAAGSLVIDEHRTMTHVDAVPTDAVDTTGAGDMYVGALAAHLAAGESLVDAAEAASALAAASVRSPGAQASYFAALT